jgi:hypothetical protein
MGISYNPGAVTDGLVLCLDAANPKSFSPNVHPYPTDLYGWQSAGNACTLSRDTSMSSPVGNMPMKMVVTGNDPYQNTTGMKLADAVTGQTWTVSAYVKGSVTTTGQLFILGLNSSNGYVEAPSGVINITPDWTRVSFTTTLTNANTVGIAIRLDGTNASGTGNIIWWDGVQVERSSTVTTFNPFTNTNRSNWTNLINSTNATLYASPVFGSNMLTFDGSTNYADFSAGTLGDVITVEMVAKIKSFSSRMPFGFTGYDMWATVGELGFNTGASDRYGLTSTQVTNLGLLNTWKHYCFVMVNNTSLSSNPYTSNKMYIDTVNQTLSQTAGTQNAAPRNFTAGTGRISGWLDNSSYKIPMDLITFKIYNKQLSQTEIQQNFNALRGRYGL